MGDHRADIYIKFSAHGKDYEQTFWINWSPNQDGIDERIIDWFRECYDDSLEVFRKKWQKEEADRQAAEERILYENLKKKYEKV